MRHERKNFADAKTRAVGDARRGADSLRQAAVRRLSDEMSGGMRQRSMTRWRWPASRKILLADEPTTALDATVQIQSCCCCALQARFGMSVIFVTHDIASPSRSATRRR